MFRFSKVASLSSQPCRLSKIFEPRTRLTCHPFIPSTYKAARRCFRTSLLRKAHGKTLPSDLELRKSFSRAKFIRSLSKSAYKVVSDITLLQWVKSVPAAKMWLGNLPPRAFAALDHSSEPPKICTIWVVPAEDFPISDFAQTLQAPRSFVVPKEHSSTTTSKYRYFRNYLGRPCITWTNAQA